MLDHNFWWLAISYCPADRFCMPFAFLICVVVYCAFAFTIVIAVCCLVDCFTVSCSYRIWMGYLLIKISLELVKGKNNE